jgi:hypothetical protein
VVSEYDVGNRRARQAMWSVLVGATFLMACDETAEHCAAIQDRCTSVQSADTFALLDGNSINACLDLMEDSACAGSDCLSVCETPVAPAREALLYGCWLADLSSERICFGADAVPGAPSLMAYSYQSLRTSSAPDFVGEFETMEGIDRLLLYSYDQSAMTGCGKARISGETMFTTMITVLGPAEACDQDVNTGEFVMSWVREQAP